MNILDLFNPQHFLGQAFYLLFFLSFLAAPMGCFMVWRKLSYFGATLSHSSIIGAVLGVISGLGIIWGVLGFTLLLAIILHYWFSQKKLSSDTLLGIVAHFSLAVGIILVSSLDEIRIDLMAYLLGDILSIDNKMLFITIILCVIGLIIIVINWKNFINLCITPEIAHVEGSNIKLANWLFTLTLAATISSGMITIGALLIIAMLIIPAACGRLFAKSIYHMLVFAWIINLLSVILGLFSAYHLNTPAGPNIVVIMGIFFIVINNWQLLTHK